MGTRALLLLLLGLLPQGDAAAQLMVDGSIPAVTTAAGGSCLGTEVTTTPQGRCTQIAAASRLRAYPTPLPSNGFTTAMSSAGQGALVGLGVGLGVGILAALVVAQGCEENESTCTVTFIVGGSALGAGIGAAVGAVVGKD
jgi:hypothetical protein